MTHPRVVLDNHENAYPSLRSSSRSIIADQCNTSFQNMFNLYLQSYKQGFYQKNNEMLPQNIF